MNGAILERGRNEVNYPNANARLYLPQADVYEEENTIVVIADMPGVSDDSIEITLEKNVLTIEGVVKPQEFEGLRQIHCENPPGNYRRVFMLAEEVNQDAIQATVKNGVLKLVLPKPAKARARKIHVITE